MKKTGCDRTPNPIFVRHAGGLKSISTDSIVYMEANACKSFFYLNDGSVVQVEMPLNMALRKMSKIAKTILRIHRSYAVNIEYINMYYNDCFIMHTGKSIPIGREYRKIARANLVSIDKRDSIPNCVEEIKEQTFYDCNIDTLTLGTRVSYIADAVNRKISVLYVSNPTPPKVEPQEFDYVFTNVYVPEESLEKYRNAEIWENFWNMQGFNVTGIEKVTVDKGKKGECYNLQGIKNSSPIRGLNIIDGKKVVVK